jgi:phosphoribosyl 1,2-cyclic phosphodiesterase
MRFAMLGSGSRGNATLIRAGATTLLMDCGFMLREAEARLRRLGVEPRELTAVVVTHEHFDHIGGVARLARKHRLPVWLSAGTAQAWSHRPVPRTHCFDPGQPFAVGDIRVTPFAVPHDAREPCHYVFDDGQVRVGCLSDAGSVTDGMRAALSGCDALMIEFNHDEDLLAGGPYPAPLKARVGGPLGHLSNAQAAGLLADLDRSRLRHLVLTHLSEKNNTPAHALAAARGVVDESGPEVVCAHQDEGLGWRELPESR